MIVDNEIDIRTSLRLTLAAAHKADRGEPYRMEAGMAKLVASEAGGRVVDRSMQIHGGYGMTKDLPFERWYREMRIRRVGEGPRTRCSATSSPAICWVGGCGRSPDETCRPGDWAGYSSRNPALRRPSRCSSCIHLWRKLCWRKRASEASG